MSSTVTAVGWLPPVPPPTTGPRHAAPETVTAPETVAARYGVSRAEPARPGRHAEPEWDREWFDPLRDEDPFDWLGFAAEDWAV